MRKSWCFPSLSTLHSINVGTNFNCYGSCIMQWCHGPQSKMTISEYGDRVTSNAGYPESVTCTYESCTWAIKRVPNQEELMFGMPSGQQGSVFYSKLEPVTCTHLQCNRYDRYSVSVLPSGSLERMLRASESASV